MDEPTDFEDPERYKVGDETYARDLEALKILRGKEDPQSATFVIANEDHTLGNSLRWILNRDPRVDFCGYSQPHPSDKLIKLRVQPKPVEEGEEPVDATEVLRDALKNLMQMCDHMSETMQTQARLYRQQQGLSIPAYEAPEEEDMDEEDDDESEVAEDDEEEQQ
ncbi:hypothetical protein PTSG_09519 [Salpingoeca rosetta]|uniref:DNA-directed RNA polymerase RBP11-like dimerisation domain-containing protein n=1 Tax=Salpingoeca rosetta (strain ATCC 50818 / BSB-021) TaxID=946362 RepID=F2UL86_SALR5|nr:uncharacterized protein PTSG_09519 [Salpingoeca rosetta]EGD77885.1 hypothetical protein PTSG_09519 [Salpingoeca rosetta]|eukprot:XP_004989949.1 hypothetical protein PTSG_09519 [Salpingoeca rosetta]